MATRKKYSALDKVNPDDATEVKLAEIARSNDKSVNRLALLVLEGYQGMVYEDGGMDEGGREEISKLVGTLESTEVSIKPVLEDALRECCSSYAIMNENRLGDSGCIALGTASIDRTGAVRRLADTVFDRVLTQLQEDDRNISLKTRLSQAGSEFLSKRRLDGDPLRTRLPGSYGTGKR